MTLDTVWRRWFPVLIVAGLLAATARADWHVQPGHVRGLPPGQPVTAAFLTLHNAGGEALELVEVSTPVAERVEIHRTESDGSTMRMVRLDTLPLPPGEHVELRPGGLHLMLIGLKQPLQDGSEVLLTLRASDGSEKQVSLPVRSVLDEKPAARHRHHHH